MNLNYTLLKSIFFRPSAIAVLVLVGTSSGVIALSLCHQVRPRYSVAALVETAESGAAQSDSSSRESLLMTPNSSTTKLDAITFLEFEYLSGNRNADGVSITEVRDQKSTNLIQIVAEGYTNEAIEIFFGSMMHELQARYGGRISEAIDRGRNQLEYLDKEILSMETFKIQIANAIQQVGPSPVLGTQLMDLNRDLSKLKQESFALKATSSPGKIHNFRLTSMRAMDGGAPVFPRSKPTVALAVLIATLLAAYALFLAHWWRERQNRNTIDPFVNAVGRLENERESAAWLEEHAASNPASSKNKDQRRFKAAEEVAQVSKVETASQTPPHRKVDLSSDLRSPLQNMIGMTSVLLGTGLSAEQREFTNSIRTAADGFLVMVDDFFSQKENARRESALASEFKMNTIRQRVEANFPHVMTKFKKQIHFEIDPQIIQYSFIGDEVKLEQLITHLTVNTLKFSSTSSATVKVSAQVGGPNEASLCVEIFDVGMEMPAHMVARLNALFGKEESTLFPSFRGGDIGLAIALKLVKSMDGELGVERTIKGGSQFWFTVPVKLSPANKSEGESDFEIASSGAPLCGYRILLAEDDLANQKMTVHILRKLGHRVDAVCNGNEALDALRELPYDLVLLDCQMPELDGYETTRIIRSCKTMPRPDIPIIAVTGMTGDTARRRCFSIGMNHFLQKPYRPGSLSGVIDEVMQGVRTSA